MTPAKKLEAGIVSYLATIAPLTASLTIIRHVRIGEDMPRPCLVVSAQDATEDEWMKGVYRGSILCAVEAHAQGTLTATQLGTVYASLLDALRSEAALIAHVENGAAAWAPIKLRYASAIDYGITEDDSLWVGAVELQCIFHT
jgi:hypothetical protein